MKYIVTYIDDEHGDTVRTWEGEAEDSGDAIDQAYDADYYVGQIISIESEE